MITKFKIFESTYVTHNNGGSAYTVDYDEKSGFVDIFKNNFDRYSEVKKAWTGIKEDDSSSVLLEFKNGKYMFVGREIYEFETTEPIKEFYSMIGNSDVPYPVALSKNYAYFMLDKVYVSRKEFPRKVDWRDSYKIYYDIKDYVNKKEFKNLKIIDKYDP